MYIIGTGVGPGYDETVVYGPSYYYGASRYFTLWVIGHEILYPPTGDNHVSSVAVWWESLSFLASLPSLFSGLTATLVDMMRTKHVVETKTYEINSVATAQKTCFISD